MRHLLHPLAIVRGRSDEARAGRPVHELSDEMSAGLSTRSGSGRWASLSVSVLVIATALGVSACRETGAATPSPVPVAASVAPGALLAAGKMSVCTSATPPPGIGSASFTRFEGTFTVELAARLGLNQVSVEVDRSGMTDQLGKRCDIALVLLDPAVASTTPDVIPFARLSRAILVPSPNPHSVKGLSDLCGLRVAVIGTGGSPSSGPSEPPGCGWSSTVLANSSRLGDAIVKGQSDAGLLDSFSAHEEAEYEYSGRLVVVPGTLAPYENVGIRVAAGNQRLADAIHAALAAMAADKRLQVDLDFDGLGALDPWAPDKQP